MLGIIDNATRKRLLQESALTLHASTSVDVLRPRHLNYVLLEMTKPLYMLLPVSHLGESRNRKPRNAPGMYMVYRMTVTPTAHVLIMVTLAQ